MSFDPGVVSYQDDHNRVLSTQAETISAGWDLALTSSETVATCTACAATCRETKDLKRFLRRHGKNCKASKRRALAAALAAGTRSVDSEPLSACQPED